MPTYEYECRSCKKRFDRFQQMMAKPTAVCPKCKRSARRLISGGAGLLFKGSGFYATDYRSSSYKKQAATECKKDKPAEGGCAEARGGASASASRCAEARGGASASASRCAKGPCSKPSK